MSPIYKDLTSDDYASGVVLTDGGLFTTLAENDECVNDHLFMLDILAGSAAPVAYPAWETLATRELWVPDSANWLYFTCLRNKSAGAGSSRLRLQLGGIAGAEDVFTTTVAALQTLSVTGISSLRGTRATLNVQSSGTSAADHCVIDSRYMVAAWFSEVD